MKVPFECCEARSGDTVSAYADVEKVKKNCQANYSLEEALKNAWEWEKNH